MRDLTCIACGKKVKVNKYGIINKSKKILKILATDSTYKCAVCRKKDINESK